jgi:hypothetical protein
MGWVVHLETIIPGKAYSRLGALIFGGGDFGGGGFGGGKRGGGFNGGGISGGSRGGMSHSKNTKNIVKGGTFLGGF